MKRKVKYEQERAERERKFVNSPLEWPHWPMLPMKRRDADHHHKNYCVIIVDQKDKYRVYMTNMHALAAKEPQPKTWGEALEGVEVKDYPDLDALLADYTVD